MFKLDKNKKYLFASDLDGTLYLTKSEQPSPFVKEAIDELIKQNHIFIPVTGRSSGKTNHLNEKLDLRYGGIFGSGSEIKLKNQEDFNKKTGWINKTIGAQKAIEVFEHFKNEPIFGGTFNGFDQSIEIYKKDWESKKNNVNFEISELVLWIPKDKVNDELINKIFDFTKDFSIPRHWKDVKGWDFEFISLSPINTDKAKALEVFANYYNIPVENIIYFGDNVNDLEAIKFAGYGVAVKNATDDIKNIANKVLDWTNDEGAVGKYILELLAN